MRKAVDLVLLALGLALAATGLWWMWAGWDIVQVEKGWAAVIAGSVMLSGGCVVVAVAWAAMRFAAIRPAMATQNPEAEAGKPVESKVSPGLVATGAAAAGAAGAIAIDRFGHRHDEITDRPEIGEREPDRFEFEEAREFEREEEREFERDAADEKETFARSVESPVDEPPAVEPPAIELPEADTPSAPEAPRRLSIDELVRRSVADEPREPAPEPKRGSLFARFGRDRLPRSEKPQPPLDVESPADEKRDDAPDFGEADHPSVPPLGPIFPPRTFELPKRDFEDVEAREPLKPLSAHDEPEENDTADEDDVREADIAPAPAEDAPAPSGDWFDEAEKSLDRASEPLSPGDEEAAEPVRKEPVVTGRYSSGDTNYTMYDDGSIEAQTPDGTMRFASLLELRRFVEQRR